MVMRSSTVQVKWYTYMYQKIKTVSVGGLFSCEHMNDYPTCISNYLSLCLNSAGGGLNTSINFGSLTSFNFAASSRWF